MPWVLVASIGKENLDHELHYPKLFQIYPTEPGLRSQACSVFDRETTKQITNGVIGEI